mmetsp:Transcript_128203/g.409863  ORF Transcript_128203/g.409863 Transcript_128203/m.409863 type:complete len:199 (+) Transcript_128203:44-640(+)
MQRHPCVAVFCLVAWVAGSPVPSSGCQGPAAVCGTSLVDSADRSTLARAGSQVPDEAGLLQTHHEAGAGRSNVAGGTPPKAAEVIENVYPPDWPYLKHCIDPHSPGGLFDFSLSECGAGQKPDFGKNASIAIVGAGPAGVSIARLLSDRGFRNIKLIESTGWVARASASRWMGNCTTWEQPSLPGSTSASRPGGGWSV